MAYIATFHTHVGALMFLRRMQQLGDDTAAMIPAPRALSVSCGSAVYFEMPFDEDRMVDDDTEGVYIDRDGEYTAIYEND